MTDDGQTGSLGDTHGVPVTEIGEGCGGVVLGFEGGEVGLVEGVRLLGRGESGVLAHRPRAVGVHGGAGTAHEGRHARQRVQVVKPFEIGGGVEGLDVDPVRGLPHEIGDILASQLLAGELSPALEVGAVSGS